MIGLRLRVASTIVVCLLVLVAVAGAQTAPPDVAALEQLAADFEARYAAERAAAEAWARGQGLPMRIVQPDGTVIQLMYLRNGAPVYYMTNNLDAADTVSTDELWPGGSTLLGLSGAGVLLHVWDGGGVLATHQELTGRVTQQDTPGSNSNHSTHVAGTMIATGVDAGARGMSGMATLDAYDFFDDVPEMTLAAAAGALASNHSYGTVTGWQPGNFGPGAGWYWFGDVTVDVNEDQNFGRYGAGAQAWDQIAANAPSYLIVKSAGNDRNDTGPAPGAQHWHLDGGSFVSSTDVHPTDGAPAGFDSVPTSGNAKNILTIAAVDDVVGGYTAPGGVLMSDFSGWGPADDGRIKPDLSANGVQLRSSIATGNADYGDSSGTSMSAPNVTGSLGLLIEHYRNTHGGADMRSATAKALAIHTADEAGPDDGPDYSFGWGLLNAQSAAQQISLDQISPSVIQELTLPQGATIEQEYPYFGTDPFKVTIAWTDPAGTPPPGGVDNATPMLVNDLDLRVIEEGGTQRMPWRFDLGDPAYPDIPAETGDNTLDNVEVVTVAGATPGLYTIQISHKGTLQGGAQDFSLITDMSIPHGTGADFVFLLDVTGSTGTLLPNWQAQMPAIIDQIETHNPGSYYGLASHLDYPFSPHGAAGEYAYRLESPLGPHSGIGATLLPALAALTSGFGLDSPESQCEAIVQALTGAGRDLNLDTDYVDTGEIAPMSMGYRTGVPTVLIHFTWPPDFHNYPTEESDYPDPANPPYHAADWTETTAAVTGHVNQVLYFGLVTGPLARGLIDPQNGEPIRESGGTDPMTELAELTGGAVLDVGGDLSGLPEAIDEVLDVVDSLTPLVEIPTLSEWGLALLALLLLVAGIALQRRRRTAA